VTESREVRSAARLLVFDGDGRVLLLRHSDRRGREFWATPGGGVEQGESFEEAARREAREELGMVGVLLREAWTDQREFLFDDRMVSQTETMYVVLEHAGTTNLQVSESRQAEGIREYRWWSLRELMETDDLVYPEDLASKIRGAIRPLKDPL
jgi:ADP-ribose pyrophosphatase YjhB (NUDIX family)